MKKIILIVSLLLLFFTFNSCRTKKVLKTESKQVERVDVQETVKTEQKDVKKESEQKKEETVKQETKTEEKKDIQIIGKTDSENPLVFYNVVNGDTIDLFKVTGNADVIFKSSNNTLKNDSNSKTNTEYQKSKEEAKNNTSVIDKASEVINTVQTKSTEVVKKNFSFGVYVTFFIYVLIILVALGLFYYLRKSPLWGRILKIFKL